MGHDLVYCKEAPDKSVPERSQPDKSVFDKIEDERSRITELLRNNGYFYFNNSFVDFPIDTNQSQQSADVVVNIRNNKTRSRLYSHC